MRPTRARVEEPEKEQSSEERDDRMELAYNFDRFGERSTLAFVTTFQAELAEEFFSWRRQMAAEGTWTGEGIHDGVRRWERTRFGADLYASAHGVLLFGVRIKLAPGEGGRKVPPGYFDRSPVRSKGLPSRDAEILASKAARGKAMPRPRMTRRERDERIMDLERQAAELRAVAATEPGEDREPAAEPAGKVGA